ncbi:MAG TPA: 3-deoxy-manno-octulosonate cytidylyltransferase [Longimicrobiales bacterium]|nr:3-deoxy-manno-octulosonate cytidylyltransferase [Longimicrobiales bacterium]
MPARRILCVIPARLGSERLPRKPLYPLAGRPLVEWVWRRVRGFGGLDRVVVATDSEDVVAACRAMGAEVALTSPDHTSGTERAAEIAARSEFAGYDVVVNVQGDEPFVAEAQVMEAAGLVGRFEIGTVASPVRTLEAWRDPAVVKVVRDAEGRALYFSRAPIPHPRGREPQPEELASAEFLRHIGIYAYTPAALARWAALPPAPLERLERLEQLRPLAAGLTIGVGVVEESEGGVDTPADVGRAELRLRTLAAIPSENR